MIHLLEAPAAPARHPAPLVSYLLATLCLLACAPQMDTEHPRPTWTDDGERERNQAALETLADRGEQQAHVEVPELPTVVLTPAEEDTRREAAQEPVPEGQGEPTDAVIRRSELLTFLEAGPHRLLTAVLVEPVMDEDRFRGFRVEAVQPGMLRASGLRVGDVVMSVNGRDISRPEGFIRVWESVASADHIDVDIVRDGQAQTLSWAIVE